MTAQTIVSIGAGIGFALYLVALWRTSVPSAGGRR